MEQLNYILTILITFLGFIIGILLSKISPEEMKPGKEYFIMLQKSIVVLIILFMMYATGLNIWILIPLIIITAIGLHFLWNEKGAQVFYILMPLTLIFTYTKQNLFLIQASLIFIYGLPTGSLTFNEKNWKKTILKYAPFLIIGLIGTVII